MARSIGTPVRTVPAGKAIHNESGSVLQITWAKNGMTHRLREFGFQADYPIDFQIGAGNIGYSYITRIGDVLLQSPASYYRRYGWDVSPGFKEAAVLDFDRVLSSACLFCHSNSTRFAGKRRLAHDANVEPIGCERCHGNTERHISNPSRANIVNPARLPARSRDSVCEQCHLEGVARILNPGKNWEDIHPGPQLDTTLSIYVEEQHGIPVKAVSQVEQLALSRCARESGGKLWCGSCHNPHAAKAADRANEVETICVSCHPKLSPAIHNSKSSDCVTCHMPRLSPNDVAHAASTDHRLLARPAAPAPPASSASIRAWQEPDPEIRQRNLALAELQSSSGNTAARLLEALPSSQTGNDPVVLSALADVYLSRGSAGPSASLFARAAQLEPANADYAMYLGIALKKKGDLTEAARAFQNAIALDASLQRAYLELSALYAKQGNVPEAAAVLQRYLKWNPQSILVRSTLDGLR